jgi:hypothetical protein
MKRTIAYCCLVALCSLALSGCRSHSYKAEERYPWHGSLTDGTNGIVQPPKW